MQSKTLRVVHDDDLDKLLQNLGVYMDFKQGNIKCSFCKNPITYENLHSVYPDSGAVKFCCMDPICVNRLIARRREINNG